MDHHYGVDQKKTRTAHMQVRVSGQYMEEENQLWKKCNELLYSDKKMSKFYVTSLIVHTAALVFVTLSVSE